MGAVDTLRKYPFGKKPPEGDALAALTRIHKEIEGLIRDQPHPLSVFERETLVEALTQIDAESKKRKAAEAELADYKAGKISPDADQPFAAPADALSYSAVISSRDSNGDMRTVELTPSDPGEQHYRIKVASRDAAGDLRAFILMPVDDHAI